MALIERRIFKADKSGWTSEDTAAVQQILTSVRPESVVTLTNDDDNHPVSVMVRMECPEVFPTDKVMAESEERLRQKGYTLDCLSSDGAGIPPVVAESQSPSPTGQKMERDHTSSDGQRTAENGGTGDSGKSGTASMLRRTLPIFIPILCIVVAFSVLLTFTLTARYYKNNFPDGIEGELTFPELELIHRIYSSNTIYEIDREQLLEAILKGYAVGTGDLYAQYYTAEEYAELTADRTGKEYCGIGVKVTESTIEYEGKETAVINVVSIFHGSMAGEAGMRVGDLIIGALNKDGETVLVQDLGLDGIVQCITGEEGTVATVYVLRPEAGGTYASFTFEIERRKIISESVTTRVLEEDKSIGIVCISDFSSFDMPRQFKVAMQELIDEGCTKFVLDVRNNLGGYLIAVESVLSMLLQPGDLMITQVYNNGNRESDYAGQGMSFLQCQSYCGLTTADLGIFSGYTYTVLTNQYTASAAELFSANLRDHQIATLIGTTTFGKGIVQNTYDLSRYGMEGALKMTVAEYLPPCGEGFHEKGITPDVVVDLDPELIEKYGNVYLIPDSENPQIMRAIQILQSAS